MTEFIRKLTALENLQADLKSRALDLDTRLKKIQENKSVRL